MRYKTGLYSNELYDLYVAFYNELNQYKVSNLSTIINHLKEKIRKLWDQLKISQQQRCTIKQMYITSNFTIETYDILVALYHKLSLEYDNKIDIFNKLTLRKIFKNSIKNLIILYKKSYTNDV